MSALAKYLFDAGNRVMGYDKTASPITSQLIDLGISVLHDQSPENPSRFLSRGHPNCLYSCGALRSSTT